MTGDRWTERDELADHHADRVAEIQPAPRRRSAGPCLTAREADVLARALRLWIGNRAGDLDYEAYGRRYDERLLKKLEAKT